MTSPSKTSARRPSALLVLFALMALSTSLMAGCGGDDPKPGSGDTAGNDAGLDAGGTDATGDGGGGGSDAGDAGGSTEACTDAPKPQSAPGDAICAVEKGTGAGMLIVADILLPGNKVIQQGGVLLDDKGEITCVGCDCAAKAADATRVLCPDAVVTPGLIDAHNHIGWLNSRPWVATENKVDPALRWEHRHDWRKGKRGHPYVNVDGGGASTTQKVWGELRYVLTGTTGLFGSGDLSGLMRDLDSTGKGDNGLGTKGADYQTFPLGDSSGTQLAKGCGYGSFDKPPSDKKWVPHVAEGIDPEARNEFLCLTGQGDGSQDLLGQQSSIIHGVGLLATDYALMAAKGIGLVWSPRSNVSLYGETARVVLADRLGVGIGLGADWIPSGSMNMLRELQCADFLDQERYGGYFGPAKLWEMATYGAARALGLQERIGILATGHVGDLAIFARRDRIGHAAVVRAKPGDAVLVLRGGKVLAGFTSVVDALETGCESVGDVCGSATSACVQRDTGKSFADVKSEVEAKSYPLFFCDAPKDEPSCLPARAMEADSIHGSTVYAGTSSAEDKDGDGIPNDKDLCPDVFSPIRPLDGAVKLDGSGDGQADIDGDGVGDSCDPCPLDADTDKCTAFDPNDPDGDGKPSSEDNCPGIGNSDQKDTDNDGKGDVCDPCPEAANPGATGCPAKVQDVKTDAKYLDQRVSIAGLIVTASAGDGWFAQDDAGVKAGTAHSAIFVYSGSGERPKRGDTVDITGATPTDYYGQIELIDVAFTVTGTAEPTVHTLDAAAAKAAAETDKNKSPWEGALVRVENVTVADDKPEGGAGDATAENEVALDNGLRLDDAIWEGETWLDPAPTKGAFLSAVQGPLAWRNGYLKLLPRVPTDVELGPPKVAALGPALAWQRVGKNGPAIGAPVTVTLSHPSKTELTLEVTSDDDSIAAPVGPFVIAAGATTLLVAVDGKAVGKTAFRAKIPGQPEEVSSEVEVLATDAMPAVSSITPDKVTAVPGGAVELQVMLAFPAPELGLEATVTVDDGLATAPATLAFDGNSTMAKLQLTAGSKVQSGSITVASPAGSASAQLEIVDPSSLSVDLSGWTVKQANSSKTFKLPAGTKLQAGQTVIITRNADKAGFEAFFKVTLPTGAVFINSGDNMPSINGDETFTLEDASGKLVEGPTPALKSGDAAQRKEPVGPAADTASWNMVKAGPGSSTPGTGCAIGGNGVYISEYSDASGTGAFVNEYVEICYSGPKP